MFRNQYDMDVSVWSPQGRIHQIDYAMEAVKQGSATVGLKSQTHAVLVALMRAPSDLAEHQKKILHIDEHIGVAIAGLTADARLLSKYMRSECLDSRYAYGTPLPVNRLVAMVGAKSQVPTQIYGRRPYGVGLLVAGFDSQGPHIYQTCPSANFFDCKANAIGSRSQSARTYLEKYLDTFPTCELEDLIKHGLRALRDTLPTESELSVKNCSIAIVGKETKFTILDRDGVGKYLAMIEGEEKSPGAGAEDPPTEHPQDEPAAEQAPADEPGDGSEAMEQ